MTPVETLILVLYFFVLSILAIYGWHRYYLVYLYTKNKDKAPLLAPPLATLPRVTVQLPIFNEMYVADRLISTVCEMDYPRELLEIQVLDDSTDETTEIAELAVRRFASRGFNIRYLHRVDRTRLQGGRARGGAERGDRRVHRDLRCGLHSAARFPAADAPVLRDRPEDRHGAGPLGAHQPGLLAAHEDPVDPARRALRARARRTQSRRVLLQLQRHRRRLAARGDRLGGRVAARHADRGPRPQLPRAAGRLALRVPPRRRLAGRSAGRDELVQVAAAPVGQGIDPDLHEAAAAHPAIEAAAVGQGRGVLPSLGQLQLPADVDAVDPHVPGDVGAVQHGVDGDAAHRRAAVLRGDRVDLPCST